MNDSYGTLWGMVDDRLGNLENGMNTIKTDVALIKDRQTSLIVELSAIKTEIYGNGNPGLKTSVALIYQKVALITLLGSTIGGLVITVVGWVVKK